MRYFLLLSFLIIIGCSTDKKELLQLSPGPPRLTLTGDPVKSTFYKRYVGTVGDKSITVHFMMFHGMPGFTYDDAYGSMKVFGYLGDSVTRVYRMFHGPNENNDLWQLVFQGDELLGTWSYGDSTVTVQLKESPGTPMSEWYRDDTLRAHPLWEKPKAVSAAVLFLPSDDDGVFERSLVDLLQGMFSSGKRPHATSLDECWQTMRKEFFGYYREELQGLSRSELDRYAYNWEQSLYSDIFYDRDGMLSMGVGYTESAGAASDNSLTRFLNYDFQRKKMWELDEILDKKSPELIALLERDVREVFEIPLTDSLSKYILPSSMYAPSDFFITDKGITFSYGPQTLTMNRSGENWFFIPYSRIVRLLKPAFKQRMGIQ